MQLWARKEHEVELGAEGGAERGGEQPPLQLIEEALVSRQEFAAIEVQTQLLYALVDQVRCSLVIFHNSSCQLSPYFCCNTFHSTLI